VRAEFRRAGHIVSADPGPRFIDRAGTEGSVPGEKGTSLEQVTVDLGYETIPGPYAVLLLQDMENIVSPCLSPALSVLFCDVGDQIRKTTLTTTHTCEACLTVHDSELSSLCPPLSYCKPRAEINDCMCPDRGVWVLGSPQPQMDILSAGTVARPTVTSKRPRFVGSATAPTRKAVDSFPAARPMELRL